MKKLFFGVLLAACLFTGTALAGEAATLSAGEVKADCNDEVKVTVSVSENPGFAAMNLEMAYDSELLEPVSIEGGSVLKAVSPVSNLQSSSDEICNPVTMFVVKASDFTGDGDVFTVTFKTKDIEGKSDITLSYDLGDIANQKLQDVDFEIENGTVTIEKGKKPVIDEDDYEEEEPEKAEVLNPPAEIPEKKEITVTIDGVEMEFPDQRPTILDNRTLVPMRAIFEKLGATVDWDKETRTAIGVREGVTVAIQINNPIMTKNGEKIEIDVPAQLINSRTMVPIRAISEAFGYFVDWDGAARTVIIETK